MKKNKLIELLNNIPGNPDVVLWNGYVEDVVDIKPVIYKESVYKLSFEGYSERLNLDRLKNSQEALREEEVKKLYRSFSKGWQFYSYYSPDKNDPWYKNKTIYVIQPKLKGETHFDRLGSIEY